MRDWARVVVRNLFILRIHLRVCSTTSRFHRSGSTAFSAACAYEYCIFGQNAAGAWAGLRKLLSRVVISRFQQKTKQNRRAARFCGNVEFIFTSGMPRRTRELSIPKFTPAAQPLT